MPTKMWNGNAVLFRCFENRFFAVYFVLSSVESDLYVGHCAKIVEIDFEMIVIDFYKFSNIMY